MNVKNSIKAKKWLYILVFIAVVLLTFTLSAGGSDDVVEKDGVLYFPDGNPVRNYEQLYIYENSR